MYFLSSLDLPTLLVLFCFVFFSSSLSSSSLSSNTPLAFLFFLLLCAFFCSLLFFYLYSRSIPLLLSTLLSLFSLFGNAALLALLFPIYASLLKCPSFFSSFFSLPHWSLYFSPSFFFPDRRPPSTPSFLIHSSFFTSFTPPPPPSPLHGSHFPFRSPLFPPIILFSLLSFF